MVRVVGGYLGEKEIILLVFVCLLVLFLGE